jgi:hypothetical protein
MGIEFDPAKNERILRERRLSGQLRDLRATGSGWQRRADEVPSSWQEKSEEVHASR